MARPTLKDYQALAGIRRGMRQFLEFSAQAAQEAAPAQAPTTNVAADSREPVTPSAPVILVNDKH